MHSGQKGIALFQVLLLVSLLGLMAVHFSLQAKHKVAQAQGVKDQVKAQLAATSLESRLVYTLLTEQRIQGQTSSSITSPIAQKWRFDGTPFDITQGQQIRLQDVNGLMAFYGNNNALPLAGLLVGLGQEPSSARATANEILAWQGQQSAPGTGQGANRGNTLSSISELKFIPGIDGDLYQKMAKLAYPWPRAYFNPLLAPDEVLLAQYGEDTGGQLLALREHNSLDESRFKQIVQPDESTTDFLTFYPGLRFNIQVTAKVGQAVASKSGFWYIRPHHSKPVIWLQ